MKKAVSLFLAMTLALTMLFPIATTAEAAVPYPTSLYLTQQTDVTCTLCATTMMLRARAYLSNNTCWTSITESAVEPYGWLDGAGLRWSFQYSINGNRMNVGHGSVNGMSLGTLQNLLNSHPEGIVLYCQGAPHAQYITDIENGVIYSADSSCTYYFGRRPITNTYLGQRYGSQANILANTTAFWYVSSYSISANTSYGGASSSSGANTATAQPAGTQTVSNGTYRIVSAVDNGKCVDVSGAGTSDGTNVQLWANADCPQQKFDVTYLNNGYYSLKATHTGKALDLYGGYNTAGTNVQQYGWNGTNAQQWVLKDTGDGYFYIINKAGLYLDVNGGYSANGTNIQGWIGNGSKAQKWKLVAVNGTQTIPNGTYRIAAAADLSKGVDVAGVSTGEAVNVHLWTYGGGANQQFDVTYQGGGFYSIAPRHSGKRLDLHYQSVTPGANVEQYSKDGTDTQNWMIRDAGDGSYYIINSNGLYLDANGGVMSNGTNLQGWVGNGTAAQKWKFLSPTEQKVADGTYRIASAVGLNKGVDISGAVTENGANAHLWTYHGGANQQFVFTYIGGGYYTIRARHSGKALDVRAASTTPGTNVWQYDPNGTVAQKWLVKDAGNGYVYLVSGTGLYLDVNGGYTADGTNVQGWSGNGTAAQRWKLIPVG